MAERNIRMVDTVKETPNTITLAAMEEGTKIIAEGKSQFQTVEELFDDLGI